MNQLKKQKMDKENNKNKQATSTGRQWFLTLSQTTLTVDEVYDKLSLEDNIEHFAVVLETHTLDPAKGKHIHAYLSFTKKRNLSLRHFDYLQPGVHVERVKTTVCVLAYISKENVCKANFDVWKKLLASSKAIASKTLIRMADLGLNLKEIQVKYADILINLPWSVMNRFVLDYEYNKQELQRQKGLEQQLRWIDRDLIEKRLTPEELATFDSDPQFQILVDYINKVKTFGSRQIHKQCCLAIVGGSSIGKTTLLLELAKHYNTYNFPIDGWHRNNYNNDFYSMWIWNEWDIRAIHWPDLLLLLEGFETDLRVKGSKTIKLDRPMLFLVSNDTFDDQVEQRFGFLKHKSLRSYEVRRTALSVRIRELNFGMTNLFFMQKLLVSVSEDISS